MYEAQGVSVSIQRVPQLKTKQAMCATKTPLAQTCKKHVLIRLDMLSLKTFELSSSQLIFSLAVSTFGKRLNLSEKVVAIPLRKWGWELLTMVQVACFTWAILAANHQQVARIPSTNIRRLPEVLLHCSSLDLITHSFVFSGFC